MTVTTPVEISNLDIQLAHSSKADAAIVSGTLGKDEAAVQGLLPFAVVLINNSGRRILQQTIKFTWVTPDGTPQGTVYTLADFNERAPGRNLPSVKQKIFVPQQGLNQHLATDPSERSAMATNAEAVQLISNVRIAMSAQSNYTATLDSVTLEGIGLVGPDTRNNKANGYDRKTTYSAADLGGKK